MKQELGRRLLTLFVAAGAATLEAAACGPEIGTQQPTMISTTRGEPPPTPFPRPEAAQPKPFTEQEMALKMIAEQHLINNPDLSAWRKSLPDDVKVTITVYSKRQKNTVDATDGLLTRRLPDRNSEVTYPTYLNKQPIETKLTITVVNPDGSRSQWDLVDEDLEGHFAAASITSSAEKGLVTERYIKRSLFLGNILSLTWEKNSNTLQGTAEEPNTIIVLYDRQPPKPE